MKRGLAEGLSATEAARQALVEERPAGGLLDNASTRLLTTAAIYGHYDLSDLERAMEALARSRREDEEPTD